MLPRICCARRIRSRSGVSTTGGSLASIREMAAHALAALLALIVFASTTANAQPVIPDDVPLRIVSWNLEDAIAAGVIERQEQTRKRWRNTFGAERRIDAASKFSAKSLKADVVMLQGVRNIKEVRRIFPARTWKLIISRQLVKQSDGRLNSESGLSGEGSTTAIAVRYQRYLRVTRFEHLLEPKKTAARPVTANDGSDGKRIPQSAALALRLNHGSYAFWVVSAALPENCAENSDCEEAETLQAWSGPKRKQAKGIIFGGRLNEGFRKTGKRGACVSQEIVADETLRAEAGADTTAGCIAFVDLKIPKNPLIDEILSPRRSSGFPNDIDLY